MRLDSLAGLSMALQMQLAVLDDSSGGICHLELRATSQAYDHAGLFRSGISVDRLTSRGGGFAIIQADNVSCKFSEWNRGVYVTFPADGIIKHAED
jgi:hypothetical protein